MLICYKNYSNPGCCYCKNEFRHTVFKKFNPEKRTQVNVPYLTRFLKVSCLLAYGFIISYGFGALSTTFMGNDFLLYTGAFAEPQFHEDYIELEPGISNVCETVMVTNNVSELLVDGHKYFLHSIKKKYESHEDYVGALVENNPLSLLTNCISHRVAEKVFGDKYFFPWFVLYKSFSALLIGVLFNSFMDKGSIAESI